MTKIAQQLFLKPIILKGFLKNKNYIYIIYFNILHFNYEMFLHKLFILHFLCKIIELCVDLYKLQKNGPTATFLHPFGYSW
ncbi:MAG TPA: hypothetical protein DCY93_02670 [Firmicutes bacterium]|nr:hypothetical protein [Bacillota bacterium]